MKPKTTCEAIGATMLSVLGMPLALPLYLLERSRRIDRCAPATDTIMQLAQTAGVATVRILRCVVPLRTPKRYKGVVSYRH